MAKQASLRARASQSAPAKLSRGDLLKGASALLGAAALATLRPATATASQPDPAILGPWLVKITTPLGPHALALWTFAPDETLLQSVAHYDEAPDESTGHGVWRRIGEREFVFTSLSVRVDDEGKAVGTVKIRGSTVLDGSGEAFEARMQVDRFDLDGELVRTGRPTAAGLRIGLESIA